MSLATKIHAIALAASLAFVGAGCKKECPGGGGGGGGGACPAPVPAAGPIKVGDILGGFGGGGKGDGEFTVPVIGGISVSVDCGAVTVQADKPEKGKSQVDMTCKFSKLGLSGNVDIKIIIGPDGKGSISATGKADFIVTTEDINAYIDLTGGSQTGNTITINATANGQCFKATLTRNGDNISVSVDNPKTSISIDKK